MSNQIFLWISYCTLYVSVCNSLDTSLDIFLNTWLVYKTTACALPGKAVTTG
ncbi:hypothetical protein Plhal304r1_c066g0153891 [Plasmopara halstedii]